MGPIERGACLQGTGAEICFTPPWLDSTSAIKPHPNIAGTGCNCATPTSRAAIHCAPPGNRPSREEKNRCRTYLLQELELLQDLRVVVALGGIAFSTYLGARREMGQDLPRPLPRFGHGRNYSFKEGTFLIASYHPSQQNTLTGRLTEEMFARVFRLARQQLQRPTAS